jgi:hypothetical protein
MSSITAADIRAFDFGVPPTTTPELENAIGAAVSGNLVAFGASVSDQHRQDVIQSLLFAQLVAGGKADRHKDPGNWYSAYQTALEQLAWIVQASSTTSRYLSPTPKFTISSVISDLLRPRVSSTELALVTNALNAYREDAGGLAQLVFECPSHAGGLGNCQFALVTEDEEDNGTVVLRIVRVSFNAPQHVTRLMTEEFTSTAQFQAGFDAMTLNEQMFGGLRSSLTKRLEPWLASMVAPLQLP